MICRTCYTYVANSMGLWAEKCLLIVTSQQPHGSWLLVKYVAHTTCKDVCKTRVAAYSVPVLLPHWVYMHPHWEIRLIALWLIWNPLYTDWQKTFRVHWWRIVCIFFAVMVSNYESMKDCGWLSDALAGSCARHNCNAIKGYGICHGSCSSLLRFACVSVSACYCH